MIKLFFENATELSAGIQEIAPLLHIQAVSEAYDYRVTAQKAAFPEHLRVALKGKDAVSLKRQAQERFLIKTPKNLLS